MVPDVKKLTVDMEKLGLPVAHPPVSIKQKLRKKKARTQKTSGKQVKDTFNSHVPEVYRDDSWKEKTLNMIYNQNTTN